MAQNPVCNPVRIVLPFSDGVAAVHHAQAYPNSFDRLITDIVMPKLNGQAVANALRKLRPTLPILLISGYLENPAEELLSQPGVGYLPKPFTAEALARQVAALLNT